MVLTAARLDLLYCNQWLFLTGIVIDNNINLTLTCSDVAVEACRRGSIAALLSALGSLTDVNAQDDDVSIPHLPWISMQLS